MGHPAIAEAAVIAVPSEKWDERPLAVCVLREGQTRDRRRAARVPRRPTSRSGGCRTRFEFVDEIPKTAVGKFRKTALREMFPTAPAAEPVVP